MAYKHSSGMIDNRLTHDDHGRRGQIQADSHAAIKRVMQKGHDPRDYCGHDGDMSGGWQQKAAPYSKSPRRPGSEERGHGRYAGQLTPRKA